MKMDSEQRFTIEEIVAGLDEVYAIHLLKAHHLKIEAAHARHRDYHSTARRRIKDVLLRGRIAEPRNKYGFSLRKESRDDLLKLARGG
jgi:hypothetical protein